MRQMGIFSLLLALSSVGAARTTGSLIEFYATRAMLERVVDPQVLRHLRQLSWTLREHLHRINVTLEHSH